MLNLISGHIKVSGSTFSKSPYTLLFSTGIFFLVMDIPVIPMDLLGDEVFTMRKLKLPQNFSGSVHSNLLLFFQADSIHVLMY